MKKIIDDNGRLFGKISVVDVGAVFLAAVLLAAALVNHIMSQEHAAGERPVRYTVLIQDIRLQHAELIREGDIVWTFTDENIGVIREVKITPAVQRAQLVDGTYVLGPIEYKYDVELIIDARYTTSNGRMFISRVFDLAINNVDRVRTKYMAWSGTVISIEWLDG